MVKKLCRVSESPS